MYVTGLSNVTEGREKKKKTCAKMQGNKAVFNAQNSFLSTLICSPETGAQRVPRSTVVGRIRKKGLCLVFVCLLVKCYGEDNQTFP